MWLQIGYLAALIVELASSAAAREFPKNARKWEINDPVANPEAVVTTRTVDGSSNSIRLTVLTDRLIRIEYGKSPFEDRKTIAVLNRNLPVPVFSKEITNDILTIKTDFLRLKYVLGQPPTASSLQVSGKMSNNTADNRTWTWLYGMEDPHNLLGTIRTLDYGSVFDLNCSTQPLDMHCAPGLISRSGFAIINNSNAWPLEDDWWAETPHRDEEDLYILGHGHEYRRALSDYTKIGGSIPLIPRYSLGIWFSRWYDYNPASIRQVVERYEQHSLPMDVFVLDMNWHKKPNWTGYSWDNNLFSPISDATAYLKHRNIALTLNLHDANGMNPWEKQYERFCDAIGEHPSEHSIPFSILNRTTFYALEDTVLLPLEIENGIDFWWIDWQQGEYTAGGNGGARNPTIWTAHVRSTDRQRRQERKRAMVLARWGGLGAHRYPVHFSGDASISWEQLSYQPYFSMTATNVGALWSHDVTGHMQDPELFTRWIQWSIFSGVSRVHDKGSSAGECALNDPETCTTVEPWNIPPRHAEIVYSALRMRASLIPYTYTAAAKAHRTGEWFVTPLYYDWPELQYAYDTASRHPTRKTNLGSQYMFGESLMVAPVVRPMTGQEDLARLVVWLPPGCWVDFSGGRTITGRPDGTSVMEMLVDLDEYPTFVKANAIIPTRPLLVGDTISLSRKPYERIEWNVFMADNAAGEGFLYEDDGETIDYTDGDFAVTTTSYSVERNKGISSDKSGGFSYSVLRFNILRTGAFPKVSRLQQTTIKFVNLLPPLDVVSGNKNIPFDRFGGPGTWSFDSKGNSVVVTLAAGPEMKHAEVILKVPDYNFNFNGLGFKISRALSAKSILDQIRLVPGSQEVLANGAFLMRAASVGTHLEATANDTNAFIETAQSAHNLLHKAVGELDGLSTKYGCHKRQGSATETKSNNIMRACNRIVKATALMGDAVKEVVQQPENIA